MQKLDHWIECEKLTNRRGVLLFLKKRNAKQTNQRGVMLFLEMAC